MNSWLSSHMPRSSGRAIPSRWSLFSLGAMLMVVTGAHLYTLIPGSKHLVPIAILDHVFDLTVALALVGIATGVGNAVLMRCRYVFAQPLDEVLFSLAVGSGILATAILLCGLVGGLQLPILIGLVIAMATFTRRGLRRVPPLVRDSMSLLVERAHPAAVSVFLIVVVLLCAQALLPVSDWDSLMYHVRVPAQFVQQGRVYLPEDNSHALLIQLVHMLYLIPLALKSTAGPALLSVMYATGAGLAMFACALRFFDRWVASGCLVLLWGSTAVLLVAATPRNDATVAFYVFLAHYALLDTLVSPSLRMYFLAAVLLGFAVGAKSSAIAYVIALSPLIVWTSWRCRRAPLATLRGLALFGSLTVSIAAPWFFKTWLLFGSPVYPYFSALRADPWIGTLFDGQIPTAELDQVIDRFARQLHGAFSWTTVFLGQGPSLLEWGGPYYFSPVLGLLPLWLIFRENKQVGWLIVPALAYAVVALPNAPVPTVRYLVPAVPALTVAATSLAYSLCARIFAAGKATAAFSVLAVLALFPASVPLAQWVTNPETVRYLTGVVSSEAYLRAQPLGGVAPHVSRDLPPQSRVLMLFEARGYYFDVPVLQDNSLMNWWFLLRTDLPLRCLKSSGISHVLVNTAALEYYRRSGIDREILRVDALDAFASRCLVPFRQGSGFILFQVKN